MGSKNDLIMGYLVLLWAKQVHVDEITCGAKDQDQDQKEQDRTFLIFPKHYLIVLTRERVWQRLLFFLSMESWGFMMVSSWSAHDLS
ncbi:hypothetical protein F8M41_020384 [Gigaspora margarita]|uniref:Uncharacterized protein n=1 Tax=Gigaspora margarita TaxID=4874 RepID=A0A8H4AIE3_GIGMA|nr:hypothetical protein F8M41_020384 [Gigaspora margarita]